MLPQGEHPLFPDTTMYSSSCWLTLPQGMSPEECAAKLSMTLDESMPPETMPQPYPTKRPQRPVDTPPAGPPVVTKSLRPSSSFPPYPTGISNVTGPASSGLVPNSPPQFTGAATPQTAVSGSMILAALLGCLRYLI